MSEHVELAKRLRNPALTATREESAEAIETLQAQVERLKGKVESLTQAVEAEKDEQARMEFHHMHALADLAADRDRLKAALRLWQDAWATGRNEPMAIAANATKNTLGDAS